MPYYWRNGICTGSEKISYQAVIRNNNGNLVTNQQVSLRISIMKNGGTTGQIDQPIVNRSIVAIYTETHTVTTNANGLATIEIGGGTTSDNFAAIDWSNGTYYLKTSVDLTGRGRYEVMGMSQLISVPYAMYAQKAGSAVTETDPQFNAWDKDYNDLANRPEIPTVPTNVSAFENDANYLTSYTETDPQFNAWDKDYNDLTNRPEIPAVPTNVSAFENDANYLTSYTETDPQFNAWDKDYNDLTNRPEIPTLPTNVSAFENDANYLTSYTETDPQFNAWDKDYNDLTNRPEIPTVPTNVSAFENDANYLTSYTETDPQFNAWDKDYNDLTNRPEIPVVPTNVSAFENDANYLTSYTETDPQFNAWDKDYNDLTNRPEIPVVPTNVSAFENDANYLTSYTETDPQFNAWDKDYNDLTNRPEIPVVPTNVSAFENDANYLTSYTETDPQFNAWDKDYNDLTNRPEIPTVPTNVSAFTNDANYITSADVPAQVNADWNATSGAGQILNKPEIPTVPTNVSAFTNDAQYITSADVPAQVNADWNATSGAGQILNKPELFSGNYNDLTNRPEIPTVPTNVSAFTNDANYITSADVPTPVNADWNATSGAGQILNKPEIFSGNYNDLTNRPEIPIVPTNVSAFANDANYITSADVPAQVNADWNATSGAGQILNKPEIPTVPTNVSAFTNDANYITSADVPAQVNADWNATSGAGQILNKPEIPTVPTNVSAFTNDANYITSADVPAQVNADWNATSGAGQILNKPEIPTVPTNVSAFTNDANYITSADVPAQVNADWNATSGAGQILNKPEIPTIPTHVSAFTNDANYITSADVPAQVNADWNATSGAGQILNKPEFFDGNYNNLTNTPDLSSYITDETQTLTDVVALSNSAGNRQIKNVADPTENQDAVTKKYVDELIAQFQAEISAFQNEIATLQAEIASLQGTLSATTFTVTFDANGGSGTMNAQAFGSGVEQALSANTFTKEHNNFVGWNTVADGSGTAYTDGQSITITESMTLYAQWTPITYTITFNANGGSGTMAEQIFAAGVEQTITANAFTRTYYTFIGWNTVADGSGTAYTNGQSITATENMTLYAQWEVATMGTFTDSRDGNTYEFVKIGSKIWMAENLRYTGNTTLGTTIGVTGSEKQRCYPNGSSSNVSKYGYLYNWSAAMNGDRPTSGMQSLCPAGWHLPSHAEWTQLKNALSGNDAGSKLAGDAELWNDGALEQSSEFGTSGFNAVPAGEYNSLKNSTIGATPGYKEFGSTAYFWTSTCESSDLDMRYRKISYNNTDITDGRLDARYVYLSIRCVK